MVKRGVESEIEYFGRRTQLGSSHSRDANRPPASRFGGAHRRFETSLSWPSCLHVHRPKRRRLFHVDPGDWLHLAPLDGHYRRWLSATSGALLLSVHRLVHRLCRVLSSEVTGHGQDTLRHGQPTRRPHVLLRPCPPLANHHQLAAWAVPYRFSRLRRQTLPMKHLEYCLRAHEIDQVWIYLYPDRLAGDEK